MQAFFRKRALQISLQLLVAKETRNIILPQYRPSATSAYRLVAEDTRNITDPQHRRISIYISG